MEKQFYRTINAINVNLCKYVNTLKRSICLLQIHVQCCAVEMENMRKVTVCVEMAGKVRSVMFQKSSVLIQPALAMVPASWASASVSLDTKERFVRKVCDISFSVVRGVWFLSLISTWLKVGKNSQGCDQLSVKQKYFAQNYLYCLVES